MPLAFTAIGVAVAPAPAAAATSCGSTPASLHFNFGFQSPTTHQQTQAIRISSIVISGLATGCDGKTAKLVLSGNSAGDPAFSYHPLATATSTVDPCSQDKASNPPTVKTGTITLDLCVTPGGPAGYVSVHDLTHVTLTVGGTSVTVNSPTKVTGSAGGNGNGNGSNAGNHGVPVATATAASTGLAFTGADIAAMTAGGLLIILVGLFLILLGRRRKAQATGDGAP